VSKFIKVTELFKEDGFYSEHILQGRLNIQHIVFYESQTLNVCTNYEIKPKSCTLIHLVNGQVVYIKQPIEYLDKLLLKND